MRFPRRLAIILLAGGHALASCWTARSARSGDVLFQDSFEHPASGWDRYQGPDYRADYSGGAYRFEVLDVQIEVDARKIDGPDDNLFGVLCRYQDAADFYFFVVSSDGYTGIGIRQQGQTRLLSADSLLPHSAVATGGLPNHLSVRCMGPSLDLRVNGMPVASVTAEEWAEGDVGLIVGAYDEAGVIVEFDRFSVLQP